MIYHHLMSNLCIWPKLNVQGDFPKAAIPIDLRICFFIFFWNEGRRKNRGSYWDDQDSYFYFSLSMITVYFLKTKSRNIWWQGIYNENTQCQALVGILQVIELLGNPRLIPLGLWKDYWILVRIKMVDVAPKVHEGDTDQVISAELLVGKGSRRPY